MSGRSVSADFSRKMLMKLTADKKLVKLTDKKIKEDDSVEDQLDQQLKKNFIYFK